MRADRLVATLLLLQARGKVTAREVAAELEVSERTARRDLDALAMAGIPVYSLRGRDGGWRLVGGATTDLTGLRSAEARALITMAASAGHATPEFRTAIAKLTQAMPDPIRDEVRAAVAAIVTDDLPWGQVAGANDPAHAAGANGLRWLDAIQGAVLDQRRVDLGYEREGRAASQRVVEPLGIVTKRGAWYLVAATDAGRRTFRLDRITSIDVLDDHFDAPTGFDLEATWRDITTGYAERSRRVTVDAVVEDWAMIPLRSLGVEIEVRGSVGESDDVADGSSRVTLGAWNEKVLTAQIAGLAPHIRLLDAPPEVAAMLADIGRALLDQYG